MTRPSSDQPAEVAELHSFSDLDSALNAQHHSIGPGPTQVAGGDHKHDGRATRKIFTPLTVTGSRGANVALANLLTSLATQGIIIDGTVV